MNLDSTKLGKKSDESNWIWFQKHPGAQRLANKKWAKKNRTKINLRKRINRSKRPSECLSRDNTTHKEWKKKHPELCRLAKKKIMNLVLFIMKILINRGLLVILISLCRLVVRGIENCQRS